MQFETTETHQIIYVTPDNRGNIELRLLEQVDVHPLTYCLAAAFEIHGQTRINYARWYIDHRFVFGWTREPAEARHFSITEARKVIDAIVRIPDIFYLTFDWEASDTGNLDGSIE